MNTKIRVVRGRASIEIDMEFESPELVDKLKEMVISEIMYHLNREEKEKERNADDIHSRCRPHDDRSGMHHDEECEMYVPF